MCSEGGPKCSDFFHRGCWREGRQRRAGTAWKSRPHRRERYLPLLGPAEVWPFSAPVRSAQEGTCRSHREMKGAGIREQSDTRVVSLVHSAPCAPRNRARPGSGT